MHCDQKVMPEQIIAFIVIAGKKASSVIPSTWNARFPNGCCHVATAISKIMKEIVTRTEVHSEGSILN